MIGVYLREHHQSWPWPEARWRWVDAALADVASRRWWVGAAELQPALQGAASVRSVDDPHLHSWLPRLAPGGRMVMVVGKNLGADSLQRWLTDQGWPTARLASSKGFRVLETRRAEAPV